MAGDDRRSCHMCGSYKGSNRPATPDLYQAWTRDDAISHATTAMSEADAIAATSRTITHMLNVVLIFLF